ncbi:MAG: insulinase family protein [Alphaproteobacteria bacterium]|nr:insulinase family protein [Alphaproteobacteria bacterium]
MNKIFLLSGLALFLFSQAAQALLFKAEEFTLPNGLHCVIVENHKAPLVEQMLWYKAGSVDEQKGKGGSAHLLEHLMFRGTKYVKDGEFNRIMEKYGISDNAFTSFDVTAYHQFADVSKLEVLLALEADRMENLNFDEKAFEAERKIVYEERMQRVENNPSSPFYERLRMMLWGDNPYGRPVTGMPQEIMSLQYSDIMDFYHKYYAPNNAILLLSGDITSQEIRPLIEKYYGNIKPRNVQREKFEVNKHPFYEILEMSLPDVSSVKVYERYLLPKHSELKNKIYDYLVLSEYLGGGVTSALYKDLVVQQKIALSVGASYNFVSNGESVFAFNLIPQNQQKFEREEVIASLREAADKAVKNMDEKRLTQIKRKMSADLVFVNDNPKDAANWIGAMLASGFSLEEVQNYESNLNAVSLKGVKDAYESLKSAPHINGILLPENKIIDRGVEK